MYGFVNSNYSGITGSLINPTSILTSKLFLDINVIGLHLNVENNDIFLAGNEFKFSRFLTPGATYPEHGEDNRIYYDNFNSDLKSAYSQIRVMGPSAMYATGGQAFGFTTGYRTLLSGNDIPFEMAKFGIEGLDYAPLHNINFIDKHKFRAASLAFAEITGTYSRVIFKHNRDFWTGGITVKGFFGTAGGYGYAKNIDYVVPNSDTLIVYNSTVKWGCPFLLTIIIMIS